MTEQSGERWTEGVCGDGAAILRDGIQITISEILERLNNAELETALREVVTTTEAPLQDAYAKALARIAELESALWYLIGDVEAAHRSHIPAPGDPPITDNEIANLLRAQSLLATYRPREIGEP